MKLGKAFELFLKRLLINVGFSEVKSDGLIVYDGAPGQMIQGLGEAHNADVLLEPPVQTPFLGNIRLLVECKDYNRKKVGLDIIRSALGLREDINHFNIVDIDQLKARKSQRRNGIVDSDYKNSYQVAVAAIEGFTMQAQNFAASHRIPLIELNKMIFWKDFNEILAKIERFDRAAELGEATKINAEEDITNEINELVDEIGRKVAVAVTNTGQLLFLHRETGQENVFGDTYSLFWRRPEEPWELRSEDCTYTFQLPDDIMRKWLENVTNDLEIRKQAVNCKMNYLSYMIVYYSCYGKPVIKMISIDKERLKEAQYELNRQRK